MPHASCLVSQGVVTPCSAAPLALVLLVVQCIAVSACLLFWAFAASFIQVNLCNVSWDSMLAGIVCLAFQCSDWLPLHAEIVCLAFNWPTACWDSLSRLLHAGIVCLASLAFNWPNASWDSSFALSMLG